MTITRNQGYSSSDSSQLFEVFCGEEHLGIEVLLGRDRDPYVLRSLRSQKACFHQQERQLLSFFRIRAAFSTLYGCDAPLNCSHFPCAVRVREMSGLLVGFVPYQHPSNARRTRNMSPS
jgi:hypothetical protein